MRFRDLAGAAAALGSCELGEVLSPARFVPSPANALGLHLLRCLLAERMADARVGALGHSPMEWEPPTPTPEI